MSEHPFPLPCIFSCAGTVEADRDDPDLGWCDTCGEWYRVEARLHMTDEGQILGQALLDAWVRQN